MVFWYLGVGFVGLITLYILAFTVLAVTAYIHQLRHPPGTRRRPRLTPPGSATLAYCRSPQDRDHA